MTDRLKTVYPPKLRLRGGIIAGGIMKSGHNIIQQFFRRARADNSGVGVRIWPKFELIQAFMHVLVTCKLEDD